MATLLTPTEAQAWFRSLPTARRIATLSPDYVLADAERSSSLAPLFLGYREGDAFWLHGVHRGKIDALSDYWDFQSSYGYGGPLTNCDDRSFLERAWKAYSQWCCDNHILAEFVRLHPLAGDWQAYGGSICSDRDTVVVPLGNANVREGYEIRCRTAVRKAEKAGLIVVEQPHADIPGRFAEFYRREMSRIGADPFYMFNDPYFAALAKLDSISLLVCTRDDEWLSAGLFLKGATALEYHLSAASPTGKSLAATNLLLDAALHRAQAEGLSHLYLGGGTNASSDNALLFFKSGFSSARLPFRYAYSIFQPELYGSLKEAFRQKGGNVARILFYR